MFYFVIFGDLFDQYGRTEGRVKRKKDPMTLPKKKFQRNCMLKIKVLCQETKKALKVGYSLKFIVLLIVNK